MSTSADDLVQPPRLALLDPQVARDLAHEHRRGRHVHERSEWAALARSALRVPGGRETSQPHRSAHHVPAVTDLFKRSPRLHVIRLYGRGRKTEFA